MIVALFAPNAKPKASHPKAPSQCCYHMLLNQPTTGNTTKPKCWDPSLVALQGRRCQPTSTSWKVAKPSAKSLAVLPPPRQAPPACRQAGTSHQLKRVVSQGRLYTASPPLSRLRLVVVYQRSPGNGSPLCKINPSQALRPERGKYKTIASPSPP